MALVQVLLVLLLGVRSSACFNLETSHAIVYASPEGSDSSYFGMSVSIRARAAALNDCWTIQIGAPRSSGDIPGVRQPGAVYRCHLHGPCRMFPLDDGASFGGQGVHEYREKKDGAWIGASMDVVDTGPHERSVVCGHRWMNANLKNPENIDVTYLMTGVCYLQDLFDTFETPVQKLLPLVDRDKIYTPKPYVVDLSTYHWGLGQAGFSVRLMENSPDVVIGAPGVTHWIGSVIHYDDTLHGVVGHFATSEIARKSRYTYLGYSVAAGRFFKDRQRWYVAGAPRSGNYHGEVFVFQYKGASEEVRLQSSFAGATFGEYFGASLAVADVNSDSFDDLIVGAPLFSGRGPDEGRIYVYLGTGRGNFMVPSQVIGGQASEGRFGTCVSSLRDLDKDGYDDVAVGAPYEDGGGAIYIHRGFSEGLQTEHSQRIRGQDIHPHLRGFGVSLSAAVDVDGNKYEDIAVGAYLSGHVVLLRSRPVVSLLPTIKADNLTLIDRRETLLNVTVCSRYAGRDAPDHVDIVRTIDVDAAYGRAGLDARTSAQRENLRLRRNQITCEVLGVLLDLSGKNYSPLVITVRNEIRPCIDGRGSVLLVKGDDARARDGFSKTCPVGASGESSREIPFAGVCGPDLTCRSDLRLSCALPNSPDGVHVLGSPDPLVLSVQATNNGEPAYHTRIKIWSDFKLTHHHHKSGTPSSSPRKTFWLDADGPLVDTYRTNFSFQLDLDALQEVDKPTRLNLMAEMFTSSLETNMADNKCRLSVAVRSEVQVDFFASSSLAGAYVTERLLSGEEAVRVTHYYELQKTGVSPLKDAELTIFIPFYYKMELLSFETEAAEWMQQSEGSEAPSFRGGGPEEADFSPEAAANCPPTNRTLFVNCSTPETGCKVLKIFFPRGVPAGLSSYVKIILSLNISAIDSLTSEKDIAHVSTVGVLKLWQFFEGGPRAIERTAAVSIYKQKSEMGVDGQVVALSVLAGGFILCLIVAGLLKRNFFRRAKKRELQALRDAEESFVYFVTARGGAPAAEAGPGGCSSVTPGPVLS